MYVLLTISMPQHSWISSPPAKRLNLIQKSRLKLSRLPVPKLCSSHTPKANSLLKADEVFTRLREIKLLVFWFYMRMSVSVCPSKTYGMIDQRRYI